MSKQIKEEAKQTNKANRKAQAKAIAKRTLFIAGLATLVVAGSIGTTVYNNTIASLKNAGAAEYIAANCQAMEDEATTYKACDIVKK